MALDDQAVLAFGANSPLAGKYVDILASRGIDRGLIGPREADRLWERHVFNSAAIGELVPQGVSVVDVGSGAGLPGIPLALARPDLHLTLLEPLLRRVVFLNEVVGELGLGDRVDVVRGRAEDCRERYPVVTARAVAPLGKLLGWTVKLFQPGGCLLAMKGSSADEEITQASSLLGRHHLNAVIHHLRPWGDEGVATVVEVRADAKAVRG